MRATHNLGVRRSITVEDGGSTFILSSNASCVGALGPEVRCRVPMGLLAIVHHGSRG